MQSQPVAIPSSCTVLVNAMPLGRGLSVTVTFPVEALPVFVTVIVYVLKPLSRASVSPLPPAPSSPSASVRGLMPHGGDVCGLPSGHALACAP